MVLGDSDPTVRAVLLLEVAINIPVPVLRLAQKPLRIAPSNYLILRVRIAWFQLAQNEMFLGSGLCVDRLNSDDPQIARERDFPDGDRLGYSHTHTSVRR
jgi:hypothetical protein